MLNYQNSTLSKTDRCKGFYTSLPHSLTENTHARMHDRVKKEHGCSFEHFADTWRKTICRLLAHILRANPTDPLVQVTLKSDRIMPRKPTKTRIGRPKADWIIETQKDAFNLLHGPDQVFDDTNMQHLVEIKQAAINRNGPSAP